MNLSLKNEVRFSLIFEFLKKGVGTLNGIILGGVIKMHKLNRAALEGDKI